MYHGASKSPARIVRRGTAPFAALFSAALLAIIACTAQKAPQGSSGEPGSSQAPTVKTEPPLRMRAAYGSLTAVTAPLWTAKEAGLFERNGLEVELAALRSGRLVTDAILAGEIDLGTTGAEAPIRANLEGGTDIAFITNAADTFLFSFMAVPGLRRAEDMRGKRLGVSVRGATGDVVGRMVLPKFGLRPDVDVILVPVGGQPEMLAALQGGAIDAAVLGDPVSLVAERSGFIELVDTADLAIPWLYGPVSARRSYIANHQEELRRFVRAYVEGMHLFKTNKEVGIQVVKQYTQQEDAGILEATYQRYASKYLNTNPRPRAEGVRTVLDRMAEERPEAATADPNSFIEPRFVKELEEAGYIQQLYRR